MANVETTPTWDRITPKTETCRYQFIETPNEYWDWLASIIESSSFITAKTYGDFSLKVKKLTEYELDFLVQNTECKFFNAPSTLNFFCKNPKELHYYPKAFDEDYLVVLFTINGESVYGTVVDHNKMDASMFLKGRAEEIKFIDKKTGEERTKNKWHLFNNVDDVEHFLIEPFVNDFMNFITKA